MKVSRNVEIDPEAIRERIKMSLYTQKELSRKVAGSDSYISSMLSNGNMNVTALRQLAALLNCDVRELVKGENTVASDFYDNRTNNLLAALYKRICSLERDVQTLSEKVGNLNFVEPTEEQMLKYVIDKLSTPKRGKIA